MFYTLNSGGCNEITALLSQAVPVCFLLMFEVLDGTSANGLIVRRRPNKLNGTFSFRFIKNDCIIRGSIEFITHFTVISNNVK